MATVKARTLGIIVQTQQSEEVTMSFPYETQELNTSAAQTLKQTISGMIDNLTTNTYIDTDVTDTMSLNELAS